MLTIPCFGDNMITFCCVTWLCLQVKHLVCATRAVWRVHIPSMTSLQPESSCAEDKCNELEEAWNSCVETAEILKEEVAEVPMGSISSRFITEADNNDFQKVFSLPKVYLQFLDVSRLNRGAYFHPNPGVSCSVIRHLCRNWE